MAADGTSFSAATMRANLIDADFTRKLDNLIGHGTDTVADGTPIDNDGEFTRLSLEGLSGFKKLIARISLWFKQTFGSISAFNIAQDATAFVLDQVDFDANFMWLEPAEKVDKARKLRCALRQLQANFQGQHATLLRKRGNFETSHRIIKAIHGVSDSKMERFREVEANLQASIEKVEGLIREGVLEVHRSTPIPVTTLRGEQFDSIFRAMEHMRDVRELTSPAYSRGFRSSYLAMELERAHISQIPFIALLQFYERAPDDGEQEYSVRTRARMAEPLREALQSLGFTDAQLIGHVDQDEVLKYNQAILGFLERKFGTDLVAPFRRENGMMRQYLINDILRGCRPIGGIEFARIYRDLQGAVRRREAQAERARQATIRAREQAALLARRTAEVGQRVEHLPELEAARATFARADGRFLARTKMRDREVAERTELVQLVLSGAMPAPPHMADADGRLLPEYMPKTRADATDEERAAADTLSAVASRAATQRALATVAGEEATPAAVEGVDEHQGTGAADADSGSETATLPRRQRFAKFKTEASKLMTRLKAATARKPKEDGQAPPLPSRRVKQQPTSWDDLLVAAPAVVTVVPRKGRRRRVRTAEQIAEEMRQAELMKGDFSVEERAALARMAPPPAQMAERDERTFVERSRHVVTVEGDPLAALPPSATHRSEAAMAALPLEASAAAAAAIRST